MNVIEPHAELGEVKAGIVVSRYNSTITQQLLDGAAAALSRGGVASDAIDVVWVPGAFEIPLTLQLMAEQQRYDLLIALGCVIRGETSHYDYICQACTQGVTRVSLDFDIPLGFGLLTVENEAQAVARASDNRDNKGLEAALAALDALAVNRALRARAQ